MSNQKNIQVYKNKAAGLLVSIIRFVIIFGLAFIILKPFIYKILMAFMSPNNLLDSTVKMIPRELSVYYWKTAFEGLSIKDTFLNTFMLSFTVGILQMLSCTLIGYGLGRFRFRGHKLAFVLVIIIMLVPHQVISIAQYLSFAFFGIGKYTISLVDSPVPIYILAFAGLGIKEGLYIYMMREFFKSMPDELENAAYIDGAGAFRTFAYIMLPNAKVMMITIFLFSFCWQWTDTVYSSLYFREFPVFANKIPGIYIRVGLSPDMLGSQIAQNAAAMLIIIPLLVLFVFCQKFLVKSIALTGLAN